VNNYQSQTRMGELSHTASGYLWEIEPSWSFDIKAVTDIDRTLSPLSDQAPDYGWKYLGKLTREVLAGRLPPEKLAPALKGIQTSASSAREWERIIATVARRLESTRPSRRKGTALLCLELAEAWLCTGDEILLQCLDFNRIFPVKPDPAKPPTYLPARTAVLRSNVTRLKCATSSPRCHPSPDEFTADRHDFEGLSEMMWKSTRAPEFECWRVGERPSPPARLAPDDRRGSARPAVRNEPTPLGTDPSPVV
jgi:hypothetical protein